MEKTNDYEIDGVRVQFDDWAARKQELIRELEKGLGCENHGDVGARVAEKIEVDQVLGTKRFALPCRREHMLQIH